MSISSEYYAGLIIETLKLNIYRSHGLSSGKCIEAVEASKTYIAKFIDNARNDYLDEFRENRKNSIIYVSQESFDKIMLDDDSVPPGLQELVDKYRSNDCE